VGRRASLSNATDAGLPLRRFIESSEEASSPQAPDEVAWPESASDNP
jgi:hypothetical protein